MVIKRGGKGKTNATIVDVAREAGVSAKTVSRVINGNDYVSEETRQRIESAIKALGYRPNRTAQSLRAQRSKIIGIIVSDIQYNFSPPLVRAAEDVASSAGYGLFLCNSDENPEKEKFYTDLLIRENVAGLIIAPTHESSHSVKRFLEANTPVVVVDRRVLDVDVDTVIIDNFTAAYQLTRHMIDNGYYAIGGIFGSLTATTARERLAGFRQALTDTGLQIQEEYIRIGAPRPEVGNQLTHELLSLASPPDAILASNHLLAIGAFEAIRSLGLSIPRNVALTAFDNPLWTSLVEPRLTVVAQPNYSMGATAAHLLLERIADPDLPYKVLNLDFEILYRESSGRSNP